VSFSQSEAIGRGQIPSSAYPDDKITASKVQELAAWALETCRTDVGRDIVGQELERLDRQGRFTRRGERLFQDLLGRLGFKTVRDISLPLDAEPFWYRAANPFLTYQTSATLPRSADIVIIGAGLTGAAAAYGLRSSGLKVVVLDQGAPASEASGRNGGNFELFPENSVGIYRGLAPGRLAYMRLCHPDVPRQVLEAISERQASLVLGLALRNRSLMKHTILDEGIMCDYSPRGWLHIAADESEEQALCDEVSLAAQQGQRIQIWSRKKIRDEFGIEAGFLGRFSPGDGTYHPLKFVCGEMQAAIRQGVELYTNTRVRQVAWGPAGRLVETDRGNIAAPTVIVATNAFTSELLPDLAAIEPYQSQIQITERVSDRARGRIVTSDDGPVYFNQPRDGASNGFAPLLMGGGHDRAMRNPHSRRRSADIHRQLLEIRDSFYPELRGQPPSAEWIGPIAFTPDGLPCIGFYEPGVIVAAGYNGYGGSYATAAGHAAAHMALSGTTPDWAPYEIFSPLRFRQQTPLFLSDKGGLWQVAAALCQQLRLVNQRISEALTLQNLGSLATAGRRDVVAGPTGCSRPATQTEPQLLATCRCFKAFSPAEVEGLLSVMKRWDLPAGTLVFTEGSPGGTCFILLAGEVDVSIESKREQQLLATLEAGALFGQVSVIDDVPRMATCSARTDVILLEIEREECRRILSSQSDHAVRFLAALNEGLIEALHKSDIRLMQLERQI
jgi:glycine/D-amino acid oxidase-like deaminating enzyme